MLEDGDNVEIVGDDLHSPAAKKAKTSNKSPPILMNGSVKSTITKRCDNTVASNGHTTILDQDVMNCVRDRTTTSLPKPPLGTPTANNLSEDPMLTPSKTNNKRVSRKKQLEQEREHLLEQKLLTARRQASKVCINCVILTGRVAEDLKYFLAGPSKSQKYCYSS